MPVTTNQNFAQLGACKVVKVSGVTSADGGGDWIPAAAAGFTAAKIALGATVNPVAPVTADFEGAMDRDGNGLCDLDPSTAFNVVATISAAGVCVAGTLSVLPPYIRPKQHGDGTGVLDYYIAFQR